MHQGATKEEILETMGVAIAMGGALAQAPVRFAMKVLDRWERDR